MPKIDKTIEQLATTNESNWMNFHLALIELRIQKGITQSEVAEQLGISQPAVSQFENLTSYPKLETVLSYALAIGAEVNFSLISK